jgi:hypothetical protein
MRSAREKRTIVKIKGGLGNQMFQYACARAMQIRMGQKLALNISSYERDGKRSFGLNHLNISEDCALQREKTRKEQIFDPNTNRVLKAAMRFSPDLAFRVCKRFNAFVWDRDRYIPLNPDPDRDIYLNGYWQSQKYFSPAEAAIRSELTVKEPLSPVSEALLKEIQNGESVCVHIRCGDYFSPKYARFLVCDPAYYNEAIDYLRKKLDGPRFYVFSDDCAYSRQILKDEGDVVIVDQNNPDYEDLKLMCHCRHFIISNSTFSWWAQYLSENERKIVIAPERWKTSNSCRDIYQENWTILQNRTP